MDSTELIGFIAGLLTTVGMVPQVWRMFKYKSVHDVSLTFCTTFTWGIFLWLVYGAILNLPAVIIWNSIAAFLGCAMIYARVRYD